MTRHHRLLAARLALALPGVAALTSTCAPLVEPPDVELRVAIADPGLEGAVYETDLLRLEARVRSVGAEFDLGDTAVVWSSDVLGVLLDMAGECASLPGEEGEGAPAGGWDETCWLTGSEDVGGERVWPLVTRLPAGPHVLSARAVDLWGGRVPPGSASAVVEVLSIEPPEIQLVAPLAESEIVTGTDFELHAWIEDDGTGTVDVSWSSSVHGMVHETQVEAPGLYVVPCHAGGVPDGDPGDPFGDCYLSPGTHLMTLVAHDGDDDGGTSHAFLRFHVVGPDEGTSP